MTIYRHDVEELLKNPAWLEIKQTIEETMVGLRDDMLELDPHAQPTQLSRQQGRYKMAEFVLMLPQDILLEIEQGEKEGKNAKKERKE